MGFLCTQGFEELGSPRVSKAAKIATLPVDPDVIADLSYYEIMKILGPLSITSLLPDRVGRWQKLIAGSIRQFPSDGRRVSFETSQTSYQLACPTESFNILLRSRRSCRV